MIEKLRRKFIIIAVSSVFIVLMVIVTFINASNYAQIGNHADEVLTVLTENNGYFPKHNDSKDEYRLPPKMSPEAPFSTRFFTVKIDNSGNLLAVDTGKISATTTSEAIEFAEDVLNRGKETGLIGNYKYQISQNKDGTLLVFVDCSRDLELFRTFLFNTVGISLVGISAVYILVLILSRKALLPIAESYEKQKQFITNASHELKTPLAIIVTNTEVLEIDYGENEWTKSIRNQVERLSQLVSSLLSLTRMDEEKNQFDMINFSLSDAIAESAEPFIPLAKANGKTLGLQIEKNISYCGNEQSIRQLVSIFLENAIKYAVSNTEIRLSLKKKGKKCMLSVFNEAENLQQGNLDVLFERFYRADSSRNSSTGGYGIGLSVAKAIVTKHKGKITAQSPDGKSVTFIATI